MAWDTDKTKALLLAAATEEFCTYGLAGARIDRIATTAGVNKERLYQYFGKKDELFGVVLATALWAVMDAVPMTGEGPDAVGDYSGRLFDHHIADTTIPRLIFWEGLEKGTDTVAREDRRANHAVKVDRLQAMLPGVPREAAADLLLTIVSLCDAWPVLPQLDEFIAGADPARASVRRASIVQTVTLTARALAAAPVAGVRNAGVRNAGDSAEE